ncbi:MAG: glycosyltransferase family 2 protein [Steroidobacter sp.]
MSPSAALQLPITLVVITYNEAANIARCLDSVPFAAEKLVIDSGSEDETVIIAKAHGARVVHQPWLGFGAQRNFAATQATHDWLLCLDADEALTPELVDELQRDLPELMNSDTAAGVMIRSAEFMGKRMRWYRLMAREHKARIYHRQRAQWSDVRVHESLKYSGKDMTFKSPFIHYLNPTLVHHELKYLKYAELKARDWNDKHRSTHPFEWPFVFMATFIKDYFFRLAILDGWRGFAAAWMAANYALYKRLRYFEMREYPQSVELAKQELKAKKLER